MKVLKYFLVLVFFLNFNQIANSKGVPPGSGEGDVPANILILLDSSASMNNKIGLGIPRISSVTVDGNGNKVLSSADKKHGGLYLFNSDGTRINFEGLRQTDDLAYTRPVWFTGAQTTATCDWRIGAGTNTSRSYNIGAFKRLHEVQYVANVTVGGTNISGENLLFVGMHNDKNVPHIFALDTNYKCRLAITGDGIHSFRGFDIAFNSQAGGPAIYAYGLGGARKGAFMLTCNFANGSCAQTAGRGRGRTDLYGRIYSAARIRVTDNASEVYLSAGGMLYGYTMGAGVNALPANTNNPFRQCGPNIDVFDIDENNDDVFYGGRWNDTTIDKHEWTSNTTCPTQVSAGFRSTLKNGGLAGSVAADDIRIHTGITGIRVVGNRLIYSNGPHVDELNTTRFTAADRDTMWQNQIGGGAVTRWTGAKDAITSILTDGTLTAGANFGFGHWNAGEGNAGRKDRRGGAFCHSNNSRCTYYSGWIGTHNRGRSNQCTTNSCINVGISSEGAARTIPILQALGVEWGTDANAFSEMAFDYYFSGDNEAYDPASDCQLNYVIVIGDGMMTNTGTGGQAGFAAQRIEQLRTQLGVRTLFVAYGGGIKAKGMRLFDALARIGSCDDPNSTECEPTIVADTPESLKTQLQSKIRQILAERLSFTAPSITATIQEGGSLYQAQFAYEQFGEWQGTILKKKLNPDGTVEHDANFTGNWDAAEKIREQSSEAGAADSRNIWTAMPEVSYIGNWDNFNTDSDNLNGINNLFLKLGFELDDYHHAGSNCSVGQTGTQDEIEGLINFVKGTDYFDYDGDCIVTEVRGHVLGDIYHSQLVEIGPPDGSTQFTDNNQEAYFRTINNYQSFKNTYSSRRNVLYAGSNSGLLHAINAETGREEWAFMPPFIAGQLPKLVNKDLDGRIEGGKGGTNAIFGVDGSPVVHDVFIKGLSMDGSIEDKKSWRTILFIPYGRGGAGFSVLDVTNPIVKAGKGPLHMFSVYNDYINNVVYIADEEGNISEYEYFSSSASVEASLEAQKADANLSKAIEDDGYDLFADPPVLTTDIQDDIAPCQGNSDAASGTFYIDGTNSCYEGTTYTFDEISFDVADGITIPRDQLNVTQLIDGEFVPIPFSSARMFNGRFEITFADAKTYNPGGSEFETSSTDRFFVQSSCTVSSGLEPTLDYSTLGETWSTPRIVRLPSDVPGEEGQRSKDKYVAIMGAGLANNNLCAGSSVFAIELDDMSEPARIYGGDINSGPITIVDTDPVGVTVETTVIETPNGSDINNAIPTTPIVITPDTAFGIPWRGAMVYINDREGKITKINFTDSKKNGAQLFDQTTLFRLDASENNRRYTFFGMDAGVGVSTKDFWLFGGTGDFAQLGDRTSTMDNILYGIRDRDYPFFKHLNNVTIPRETNTDFRELAHRGANAAKSIENLNHCSDVTGDASGNECPSTEDGWVIHLEGTAISAADGNVTIPGGRSFRKASAPPTLFKGQVYFPVYEPPPGTNRCNIGNAYICASDDECGTNNSHKLVKGSTANAGSCTFVREGVLSELVIFDKLLYANVAGPSENPDTLYSILAIAGEVLTNKGGWRDTGF